MISASMDWAAITIRHEIEAAIAPLKAQIAELKTLAETSRPPVSRERRGHGDARGPNSFEWRQ
jgi:hypothetical protein